MKLVSDPVAAAWIEGLAGVSGDFEWDAGNQTKHRKHGVTTDDVEEMFRSDIVLAGLIVEPKHGEKAMANVG